MLKFAFFFAELPEIAEETTLSQWAFTSSTFWDPLMVSDEHSTRKPWQRGQICPLLPDGCCQVACKVVWSTGGLLELEQGGENKRGKREVMKEAHQWKGEQPNASQSQVNRWPTSSWTEGWGSRVIQVSIFCYPPLFKQHKNMTLLLWALGTWNKVRNVFPSKLGNLH